MSSRLGISVNNNRKDRSLACTDCGTHFRRKEHLSRHLQRHSGARPHQCDICMKTFPRNDTLKRHISTHGPEAYARWLVNNPQNTRRACQPCANKKQRCDGDGSSDCSNCISKWRRCVYQITSTGAESLSESASSPTHAPPLQAETDDTLRSPISIMSLKNVNPSEALSWEPGNAVNESVNDDMGDPHMPTFSPNAATRTAVLENRDATLTENLGPTSGLVFPLSPWSLSGTGGIADFWFGGDLLVHASSELPELVRHDNIGFNVTSTDDREVMNVSGQRKVVIETDDEDTLMGDWVPHVPQISQETRAQIIHTLTLGMPHVDIQQFADEFPSVRHLDSYIQLYFEHFHPRWPILHMPTFQATATTWQLVIATAAIGCQYSASSQRTKHVSLLHGLGQQMVKGDVQDFLCKDTLVLMQSLLLFQHIQLFSGNRKTMVHLQLYRNVLATLCRRMLAQDGTILRERTSAERPSDNVWLEWVREEAERRVICFTWITECLQAALLMFPPLLTLAELRIPLPGPEKEWQSSYQQWLTLQPSLPPATLCIALGTLGTQSNVAQKLDSSAKFAVLLSAFVQHIASQDLRRAMGLLPGGVFQSQVDSCPDVFVDITHTALDVMLKLGTNQAIGSGQSLGISNDVAIMARVLALLAFTPVRLLLPFGQWQTSDDVSRSAREQLLGIVNYNTRRAKWCMHQAAQVFQYFRTLDAMRHIDTISLLICMIYLLVAIELIEKQHYPANHHSDNLVAESVIRIDQVSDNDKLQDWFNGRQCYRAHVTGIGLLADERSVQRLFKESSRIMAKSAASSALAKALAPMLELQATGTVPEFNEI